MPRRKKFPVDPEVDPRGLHPLPEASGLDADPDPETDPLPEVEQPELEPGAPFDPIDWPYLNALVATTGRDIADHYYRARLVGAGKLPAEGPLIVAPNHSGNAFPHDAMILDLLLWRARGFRRSAKFRSVFAPKLAAVWWMRPYGLDNWWRRCGGVDMTFSNFDQLLRLGKRVVYYPEGVPGIGKGFTRRYQLQHFYSSFVVLAARHDVPVFPVSVVNAEWVNPGSVTFKWLDALFSKTLGIPFVPLPIAILALLFPFLFYFAFPCNMLFVVNEAVDVRALLKQEGCTDMQEPDREAILRVAERIRQASQQCLDEAVAKLGQRPYRWKTFWRSMKKVRGRRFRTTPFGWPYAFVRHDRNLRRPPARNRLHAFLRDWDLLAYYVPFGWALLALTRRFRRPPYGYRGLTKPERIDREGRYRWSLDTRPLPE